MSRKITRIIIGAAILVAVLFALTLPGPRLTYASTQPKDRYGPVMLKYELQNRSLWPIYYDGYSPAMPLYRVSYRSGDMWQERPAGGFCGTGVRPRRLEPWKTVLINVNAGSVDTSRVFRVGVPYYRSTWRLPHYLVECMFHVDSDTIVWSKGGGVARGGAVRGRSPLTPDWAGIDSAAEHGAGVGGGGVAGKIWAGRE